MVCFNEILFFNRIRIDKVVCLFSFSFLFVLNKFQLPCSLLARTCACFRVCVCVGYVEAWRRNCSLGQHSFTLCFSTTLLEGVDPLGSKGQFADSFAVLAEDYRWIYDHIIRVLIWLMKRNEGKKGSRRDSSM